MNSALIGIGINKPALRKKAIEAARRIGKVEVDHGETNCKTPDAVPYIEKAAKRKPAGPKRRIALVERSPSRPGRRPSGRRARD
jgi:hypothetical protein